MKSPQLSNQSGQMIVEAVLIIVILLGVTFTIVKFFKDDEVLKTMVAAPWQSLSGMLQNGVWGPPSKTNSIHPAGHARHVSLEGELAR